MNRIFFFILTVVCLLTILINILTSYKFMNHLLQTFSIRKQEFNKIHAYESFLSQLKDAEIGHLGYTVTGNDDYLKLHQNALDYFNSKEIQDFISEESASSNPIIAERMKALQGLKQKRLDELKSILDKRKNEGLEGAHQMILSHQENGTMDKIRQLVTSIKQEKQNIMQALEEDIQEGTRNNLLQLLLSNAIAALLLIACLTYIYRYIQKLANKDKELSQTVKKLNESLAMQQAILNSTNYAVITTDNQGVITSFNPAAEKILGYKNEEVVGKFTPEIFHDKKEMEERAFALFKQTQEKIPPNFEVIIALAKHNIAETNEWIYIRKDGKKIPMQLSIAPIKDENNQIIGFVKVIFDLTEQKKFESLKDELLNLTRQEIREPIAAIKGTLDLISLYTRDLPDKAKHILEIGKKSCEHLIQFMSDVVEIQKIETGKLAFKFEKLDLSSFLPRLAQINFSTAKRSNISLVCSQLTPHCIIEADEAQLIQAMNRLITCVIHCLPEGETIEIAAFNSQSIARIEIKAKNPKILPEIPIQNTEESALDPSITHTQKQINELGLKIAKAIIEKHRGTFGLQTNSNEMTCWLEFPKNF